MKYITGTDRSQINLFPVSLDQSIEHDNEIRLIDAFVNSMPIEEYGFKTDFVENGRPGYHHGVLLKLFIYGYLNRVRSSRNLEKECKRNIELMWLLEQLTPDHNTISNFRRDNKKAIKKVFRSTVKLANNFDLIGCRLLAGDSNKFRAQNSKKNNYNQGKVNRHLEYIDNKLSAYQKELEENDGDIDKQEKIKSEIQKHQQRKEHYKSIEKMIATFALKAQY